MTPSHELQLIAGEIASRAPDHAARLRAVACRVRRIEFALDEIADDERESADLAERDRGARRGWKLEVVKNG